MPARNGPSDKKYLLALRQGDLKLAKERHKRVWDRLASDAASLKLQATEYERRMNDLNHAHQQAQEVAHTYVTLDKYEQYVEASREALSLALTSINKDMAAMENRTLTAIDSLNLTRAGNTASGVRSAAIWGYALGALGAILTIANIIASFKK
jgi:hypothetical protein